ncbi:MULTISPECIES: hypothetical protein [Sporosarcina]|uniref:hypothetical protein n=1 Tax=Sporosarcina TaxID=1569 RepID=UPI00058ACC61|nr:MULTISPECIES: hypothetical protein [Sporosarcina]WJY26584.1 hypothetical protein QWT68_10885 [Sporosarcina sp. 0.2-SM1T-5]
MVSISMSPAVSQQVRAGRLKAEAAYSRDDAYVRGNAARREEAARNLQAAQELPAAEPFRKLGAGQLKQVALPLGETLEETIDSWRNVRREALSASDPAEVDHQLAAAASAKIMEAEAQLALEDRLRSAQLAEAALEERSEGTVSAEQSVTDVMRELYEQAASAYAVQTEARARGYEVAAPAFFLTA